MESSLYRLRQENVWGDYGSILMMGLGAIRDAATGQLGLERAGPFVPPMMFTHEICVGLAVLVSESFREKLNDSGLGRFEFKPTVKKRIVSIPWHTWDREAKFPPMIPDGGEPEDYLLDQPHSEEAASEMESIWEFIAPVLDFKIKKREPVRPFCWRWYITRPRGEHGGLFRPPGNGHVLFVNDRRREWFEREADGWVDFDEVTVRTR
jgi:hypothetical protein